MEDSTTFDFVEDSKAGMEFLCRLMEREVNALLLTDFAEFVANPEKDGQAVIVRNGFYARSFKTSFGMMTIRIPRDRANLYADRLPPYKHSLPGLCHDILALYRKDMTYSEIREFLMAESGCSFSETTIQKVVSSAYGEYRDFMAEELEDCTSQEKVDTSGTPFSHTPYLFCTMAGSLGLQYLSLYWTGVR